VACIVELGAKARAAYLETAFGATLGPLKGARSDALHLCGAALRRNQMSLGRPHHSRAPFRVKRGLQHETVLSPCSTSYMVLLSLPAVACRIDPSVVASYMHPGISDCPAGEWASKFRRIAMPTSPFLALPWLVRQCPCQR